MARTSLTFLPLLGLAALLGACRSRSSSAPKREGPRATEEVRARGDAGARATGRLRLEGRVEDGAGRPVAQAHLFLWPEGSAKSGVIEARSRADGGFAFTGLAGGAWRLLAEAPGFGTVQRERVAIPGPQIVLRLAGEARSLGGIVVSLEGGPVPGARVLLGGPALPSPRVGRTDEKGTFLFHGLGHGRYAVRASDERQTSRTQGVTIDEGTGWLPPVRLTLGPGAAVRGRVLDDTGRPVARAVVEVEATPSDDFPDVGRTGEDGGFVVGPLPPGTYQATAQAPRHAPGAAVDVRLRGAAAGEIRIVLARAAALTGRLVNERGAPLAGTVSAVGLLSGLGDDVLVLPGSLPLAAEAATLPATALARRGRARSAPVGPDGHFALTDLAPGRYRIEAQADGRLPRRGDPLALAPGATVDLGAISLESGLSLRGRVLGPGGAPLAGARIAAQADRTAAEALATACDEDGRFILRVPAGSLALTASARGFAAQTRTVVLRPGAAPAPLELQLVAADAALAGFVKDEAGRSVRHATVEAFACPADAGAPDPRTCRHGGARPLATARTNAAGRFDLTGIPAAPLLVEAHHRGASAGALVRPGTPVTLTLGRPPRGPDAGAPDAVNADGGARAP